ncbi:MAG: fibronectin type III domain-containing protein, partial [Eubacterium sp.]|nr:fibronectin type III domain-containing protein [Eubacterium sp.]
YICSNCKASMDEIIPATGNHQYSLDYSLPADCGHDGVKHYICSNCKASMDEIIPATGNHQYSLDYSLPADCVNNGVKHYICSNCKASMDEIIPATGDHNYYLDYSLPADCGHDGVNHYICRTCKCSKDEVIPANGRHVFGAGTVVEEADCGSTGVIEYTCINCKYCYAETIPATGNHVYTPPKNVVQPTCGTAGSQIKTCMHCGYIKTETIPPTGKHSYDSPTVIKNATCTESGILRYTCSVCKDSYDENIPKIAHTEGEVVKENEVPATYETEGSYIEVIYCTECGKEISRETKKSDALDHAYEFYSIDWDTLDILTGKVTGKYVCERDETHTTTAEVQTTFEVTQEATEDQPELTTYTYSIGEFDESKTVETAPALPHNHIPAVAVKENEVPATCKAEGSYYEVVYCTVCNAEISREKKWIDKAEHNYVAVVTKPTCTDKGYTVYTCSVCKDSYIDDYIDALGHIKVVKDNAVAATCEKSGLTEGSHCSECGKIIVPQKTVKAKGHKEVIDKAVPATFNKAGKTEGKHCSVCKKILVYQKPVEKLGLTSFSKITALSKGFKATWKSIKSIDGYQIQYSTSSTFKTGSKTVKVSGYKSTSKTVKKLKAKKKYYVRIRAYKKISGKTQYSSWSSKKTVTTKK